MQTFLDALPLRGRNFCRPCSAGRKSSSDTHHDEKPIVVRSSAYFYKELPLISLNIPTEIKTDGLTRLAPLIAGILALFVLYLRTPSSFISPQFWGEDGVIFWYQQAVWGWKALFVPEAGYHLLAPRLVAAMSSVFDPAYAPALFFIGYCLLTFWSACTAAASVSDPRLGVMLGVGLMLPPIGLGEILGTVTNIQWVMAPTLALLLLPGTTTVNRAAYSAVSALTGPFSVFLAPIAAYRLLRSRDPVSAIILTACVIQIFAMVKGHTSPYASNEGTIRHLIWVLAYRPFVFSAICMVLGGTLLLASLQKSLRDFRLVLIYLAAAVMVGTLFRFLNAPLSLDAEVSAARYFYIPRVAAIWCALSIAWKNAALAAAFILSLEFAGLDHLKKPPLPNAEWAKHYRAGEANIQISPPGWKVDIPSR